MIEAINVSKAYTRAPGYSEQVLDNVNLSVQEGEFLSIMGPSGSGKSTLLYILGGMEQADQGQVNLLGDDMAQLTDKALSRLRRKAIGFIFQSYNLVPSLTVTENCLLPLLFDRADLKAGRQDLASILSKVGLADYGDYYPSQLSGGQQQRVAIARALLSQPQLILADEATGNLDSASSQQVMTLLSEINKEGVTIVQVTHQEEIADYGTRTLHMKDGKLHESSL